MSTTEPDPPYFPVKTLERNVASTSELRKETILKNGDQTTGPGRQNTSGRVDKSTDSNWSTFTGFMKFYFTAGTHWNTKTSNRSRANARQLKKLTTNRSSAEWLTNELFQEKQALQEKLKGIPREDPDKYKFIIMTDVIKEAEALGMVKDWKGRYSRYYLNLPNMGERSSRGGVGKNGAGGDNLNRNMTIKSGANQASGSGDHTNKQKSKSQVKNSQVSFARTNTTTTNSSIWASGRNSVGANVQNAQNLTADKNQPATGSLGAGSTPGLTGSATATRILSPQQKSKLAFQNLAKMKMLARMKSLAAGQQAGSVNNSARQSFANAMPSPRVLRTLQSADLDNENKVFNDESEKAKDESIQQRGRRHRDHRTHHHAHSHHKHRDHHHSSKKPTAPNRPKKPHSAPPKPKSKLESTNNTSMYVMIRCKNCKNIVPIERDPVRRASRFGLKVDKKNLDKLKAMNGKDKEGIEVEGDMVKSTTKVVIAVPDKSAKKEDDKKKSVGVSKQDDKKDDSKDDKKKKKKKKHPKKKKLDLKNISEEEFSKSETKRRKRKDNNESSSSTDSASSSSGSSNDKAPKSSKGSNSSSGESDNDGRTKLERKVRRATNFDEEEESDSSDDDDSSSSSSSSRSLKSVKSGASVGSQNNVTATTVTKGQAAENSDSTNNKNGKENDETDKNDKENKETETIMNKKLLDKTILLDEEEMLEKQVNGEESK